MNYTRSQYKLLIFKILTLILLNIFLTINTLAVTVSDSVQINTLYDSSRYYYKTGNYNLAINILNKAIRLKELQNSDYSPEYFKIYNRLGIVYKLQGKLLEAVNVYEKALNCKPDAYYSAILNGNIANIYAINGDYLKAINYNENSLIALQNCNKNGNQIEIMSLYHNQGYLYFNLGNYNKAREKYLKSIQIALQNNISDIGDTYYNCGMAYEKLDSLKLAERCYEKAIITNKMVHGEKNILTTMSYLFLARFYANIGKYNEAKKLYNKIYPQLLASVGNKHPYVSQYYKYKGDLYYNTGRTATALSNYQKSLVAKIPEFNDSSIYQNPTVNALPDIDLLDILKAKAKALEKLSEIENRELNSKMALNTFELTAKFIEQLRTGYFYEESKLVLTEKEHETYTSIIDIAFTLFQITHDKSYQVIAFNYS